MISRISAMLHIPMQMVIVALTGWVNREHLAVIKYLKEDRVA